MAHSTHYERHTVDQMTFTVEDIDPKRAEQYLEQNFKLNRNLMKQVVARYAGEMERGDWSFDGQTITFDTNGDLVDGQHRLAAVVQSKATIRLMVVRGAEPETAYRSIDDGVTKSLGAYLKVLGETNVNQLAAALRFHYRWVAGTLTYTQPPTRAQALRTLERNPGLRDAAAHRPWLNLKVPSAPGVAFAHQIRMIDPLEAAQFIYEVKTGDAAPGTGGILLRTWMTNQAIRRGGTTDKPNSVFYLAMMIKGWNNWARGELRSNLVWRRGGAKKEPFPALLDMDCNPFPPRDEIEGA